MNDYQILHGAPEGATHYDGTYYRYEAYEHGQAYLVMKDGTWQRGTPSYPYKNVRSLADIKRLVSFYGAAENMKHDLMQAIEDVVDDFIDEVER